MEEVKEVKEEEGRRRKKARKKTTVKKKGKGRREKRKARRAGSPLIHPNSRSPAPGGCILLIDNELTVILISIHIKLLGEIIRSKYWIKIIG